MLVANAEQTATLDYIIPNFVKVLHSNDALARTLTLKSVPDQALGISAP